MKKEVIYHHCKQFFQLENQFNRYLFSFALCYSFLFSFAQKKTKVEEGKVDNLEQIISTVFSNDKIIVNKHYQKYFQDKENFFDVLKYNKLKYNLFFEDQQEEQEQEQDKDLVGYIWALRTNLLHWLSLTPNIGVEYRTSKLGQRLGILADGAYTDWTFFGTRIVLWKVSPEIRYYWDKKKQAYVGLSYSYFNLNIQIQKIEGVYRNLHIASITTGYELCLSKKNDNFYIDFNVGLGYGNMHVQPFKFDIDNEGIKNFANPINRHYLGLTRLGISLVWAFIKPKVELK